MKGKEEPSKTILNEKEANQLSHNELKEQVIKKIQELTQNYQKLQGNYNELAANYINLKKGIETINKGQEEMKNTISKLQGSKLKGQKVGSMKQMFGSANWRTRQKKTPRKSKKRKIGSERMKRG